MRHRVTVLEDIVSRRNNLHLRVYVVSKDWCILISIHSTLHNDKWSHGMRQNQKNYFIAFISLYLHTNVWEIFNFWHSSSYAPHPWKTWFIGSVKLSLISDVQCQYCCTNFNLFHGAQFLALVLLPSISCGVRYATMFIKLLFGTHFK